MKKYLTSFFDDWWNPLLFWITSIGLIVLFEILNSQLLRSISLGIIGLSTFLFSFTLDKSDIKRLLCKQFANFII